MLRPIRGAGRTKRFLVRDISLKLGGPNQGMGTRGVWGYLGQDGRESKHRLQVSFPARGEGPGLAGDPWAEGLRDPVQLES